MVKMQFKQLHVFMYSLIWQTCNFQFKNTKT